MLRYKIKLTKSEIDELHEILNKGSHSAHTYRAALILLNCDQSKYSKGSTNEEVSKILQVGMRTIDRLKKRFIEEGMDAVLERRPTSREYERKMDGDLEAKLVTLCCSDPPKGYARWSLRLLADKLVALNYVDSISHVAVRTALKKTNLSLGK
jgi:transposase